MCHCSSPSKLATFRVSKECLNFKHDALVHSGRIPSFWLLSRDSGATPTIHSSILNPHILISNKTYSTSTNLWLQISSSSIGKGVHPYYDHFFVIRSNSLCSSSLEMWASRVCRLVMNMLASSLLLSLQYPSMIEL